MKKISNSIIQSPIYKQALEYKAFCIAHDLIPCDNRNLGKFYKQLEVQHV